MNIIFLLFGVMSLLLSLGYLYKPDTIVKINEFFKKRIFNDQHVIFRRKKIGIVLLVIGVIAFFLGIKS